MYKKHKKYLFN